MNWFNRKNVRNVMWTAVLGFLVAWPMGLFAMAEPVIVVERDTSYNPDVIRVQLGQVMEVRNRDEFWHSSLISKVDQNGFVVEVSLSRRLYHRPTHHAQPPSPFKRII